MVKVGGRLASVPGRLALGRDNCQRLAEGWDDFATVRERLTTPARENKREAREREEKSERETREREKA